MVKGNTVVFHFAGGESVSIMTSEPEEIIQMVANQSDGWLQYDDLVINVHNVSFIRVLNQD